MVRKKAMSPKKETPSNIVKGTPTKELFISMLIRDISLVDAISDLVDNCVDGAIKLKRDNKFSGLKVDINLSAKHFSIKDNCGGIDKKDAQEYAFRFGRPLGINAINYSVGQFGIGMKRALFKMGNNFVIKSVSPNNSFTVNIDVNKWRGDTKNWDFKFETVNDNKSKPINCGTEITITSLKEDVAERFKQSNFESELIDKLELQHLINISKGFKISINKHALKANPPKLLNSNKFTTAYSEKYYDIYDNMNVKIYSGISTADSALGGWYIFCNNRLIRGPEQTEITGWGDGLPKYHSQYNRFRGLVFFKSKKPSVLPWNTSKNGLDIDSPIFQSVRQDMINLAKPVMTFLNKVHTESVNHSRDEMCKEYLEKQMQSASLKNYEKVKTGNCFVAPERKSERIKRNEITIQYRKPKDEVNKLKKTLNASSAAEVGEKTFDYTYKREC
jgi:hypothetical protein